MHFFLAKVLNVDKRQTPYELIHRYAAFLGPESDMPISRLESVGITAFSPVLLGNLISAQGTPFYHYRIGRHRWWVSHGAATIVKREKLGYHRGEWDVYWRFDARASNLMYTRTHAGSEPCAFSQLCVNLCRVKARSLKDILIQNKLKLDWNWIVPRHN
jgi:hypothetical protein